jgi:hypothetical protein
MPEGEAAMVSALHCTGKMIDKIRQQNCTYRNDISLAKESVAKLTASYPCTATFGVRPSQNCQAYDDPTARHLVCLLYVRRAGRRVLQENATRRRVHVRRLLKEFFEEGASIYHDQSRLSLFIAFAPHDPLVSRRV